MCVRVVCKKNEIEIRSIWTVWVGVLTLDKTVYNCWTANRWWIVETDTDRGKGQSGLARQWDMGILCNDVRNTGNISFILIIMVQYMLFVQQNKGVLFMDLKIDLKNFTAFRHIQSWDLSRVYWIKRLISKMQVILFILPLKALYRL